MNIAERRKRALYLSAVRGWAIKRIAHELGTTEKTTDRDLAEMRRITEAATNSAAWEAVRPAYVPPARPPRRRRVRAEQGEGLFS